MATAKVSFVARSCRVPRGAGNHFDLPLSSSASRSLVTGCSSSSSRPAASVLVPLQQQRRGYSLRLERIPENILKAEYAVRGEIIARAEQISKEIAEAKNGAKPYPFEKLVPCNIGNPQVVGQPPLTFHRQVLSVLGNNGLLDDPALTSTLPADVVERGMRFRGTQPGAYTHSRGHPLFRRMIADYIDKRDKIAVKADPEHIYVSNGASGAVITALELLIRSKGDGIMIPVPQYPLYSASITKAGGTWVGYELTENYDTDKPSWGLDIAQLREALKKSQASNVKVRAIAVINPGNPTGNVMGRSEVEAVVDFAKENDLVILADEVYQDNVYDPSKEFVSFRSVVRTRPGCDAVQLFSFHSISKGYYGECGLRGGYMHLTNLPDIVHEQVYKLASMQLCSNTVGQAMMASVLNPPQEGDPSYELFQRERATTLDGLKKKAKMLSARLNAIPGIQCMPIEGAMYAFPQVDLPQKFIDEARAQGKNPDTWYCYQILEKLGVITVPGSGFEQRVGTWHFRTTILPAEEELVRFLDGLEKLQADLYAKYGQP
ncbi:unnamed protein product [Amoebophrya sp. A25]|nr:unnamed protein product [Amoebophrya sp. A25]|eukprot:GSA25T00011291001.1